VLPDPLAALPPVLPEDEPLAEGVLLEPELGGVLLEPLELVEPPAAESFLLGSAAEDEELEEDGELGVVALPDAEPEVEPEPDGVEALPDGVELEPADDEEPGALPDLFAALSPQAVSRLAPSAMETATARVESLISGPPWVGVKIRQQDSGP
jgi:hypothetical protein